MAAPKQRRTDRPSRRAVIVAFGIAIFAAIALVGFAVVAREDSNSGAAPGVDLAGIPQSDRILGNPAAKVMLVEYADPQCPACRLYTLDFFPTLVRDYVRTGKVKTEFRGFPFIGEDSVMEKEYLVRVAYHGLGQPAPTGQLVRMDDDDPITTNVQAVFPPAMLARLRHGLSLDGQPLKPARVEWQNPEQLRFVLTEGKKRQIRRMCELVGLKVVGLKRVRIGKVMLGNLPVGQWRYLGPHEKF